MTAAKRQTIFLTANPLQRVQDFAIKHPLPTTVHEVITGHQHMKQVPVKIKSWVTSYHAKRGTGRAIT